MLVLSRYDGEWIEITHRSGDVLRVRVYDIRTQRKQSSVRLGFDDEPHNFAILRAELGSRPTAEADPT